MECRKKAKDCEDKNSTHYFMCHMIQEEFCAKEKVPKFKFNMIRKALENHPSPKKIIYFGKRPNE